MMQQDSASGVYAGSLHKAHVDIEEHTFDNWFMDGHETHTVVEALSIAEAAFQMQKTVLTILVAQGTIKKELATSALAAMIDAVQLPPAVSHETPLALYATQMQSKFREVLSAVEAQELY